MPPKSTNYLETVYYTTLVMQLMTNPSIQAKNLHRTESRELRRASISHPIKRDPEVLLTIFDQTRDRTMRANVVYWVNTLWSITTVLWQEKVSESLTHFTQLKWVFRVGRMPECCESDIVRVKEAYGDLKF